MWWGQKRTRVRSGAERRPNCGHDHTLTHEQLLLTDEQTVVSRDRVCSW